MERKLRKLREILASMGRVLIAFSGGVDSAFLLRVAVDTLEAENVLAATAVAPIHPRRETEEARRLAAELGVEHILVELDLLGNPDFTANPPDRCYHCKRMLMQELASVAAARGIPHIAEGSNVDDLGDYRPGRKALAEFGVRSPLLEAGLTKAEIRELSRRLGLPTWDKPPMSCLATRIPYGEAITLERLSRIAQAEESLIEMGFRFLRVRDHGTIARVEVPPQEMQRLLARRDDVVRALKDAGYRFVTLDLEGYRAAKPL